MKKSLNLPVFVIPGQVPKRTTSSALDSLTAMPAPTNLAEARLAQNMPVRNIENVTKGLIEDKVVAGAFQKFVKSIASTKNEIVFRSQLMRHMQVDMKAEPTLRRALLERSLSFYNGLRKSEEGMEKSGEGSKGGHVIGHTSSGKPIYAASTSAQDKHIALRDHHREEAARLRQEAAATAMPAKREKNLEANRHEAIAKQHHTVATRAGINPYNPTSPKAQAEQALNASKSRGVMLKSLGDIEKAEPRGGSYHRRVTDPESGKHRYYYSEEDYAKRPDAHVSGSDVKKNKAKKAVLEHVANHGEKGCDVDALKALAARHDPEHIADAVREHVKAGAIEHKNGKLIAQGASDFQKSEGARGGKVIGHTSSGKPIYETANHPAHKNFTAADHHDAYQLHEQARVKLGSAPNPAMASPWNATASDHERLSSTRAAMDHHEKQADIHFAAKHAVQKSFQKSEGNMSIHDWLAKSGGEGSRGGKVIGHTSSGKPIYATNMTTDSVKRPEHAGFTKKDHADAAAAHDREAAALREKYKGASHDDVSDAEVAHQNAVLQDAADHRAAAGQSPVHPKVQAAYEKVKSIDTSKTGFDPERSDEHHAAIAEFKAAVLDHHGGGFEALSSRKQYQAYQSARSALHRSLMGRDTSKLATPNAQGAVRDAMGHASARAHFSDAKQHATDAMKHLGHPMQKSFQNEDTMKKSGIEEGGAPSGEAKSLSPNNGGDADTTMTSEADEEASKAALQKGGVHAWLQKAFGDPPEPKDADEKADEAEAAAEQAEAAEDEEPVEKAVPPQFQKKPAQAPQQAQGAPQQGPPQKAPPQQPQAKPGEDDEEQGQQQAAPQKAPPPKPAPQQAPANNAPPEEQRIQKSGLHAWLSAFQKSNIPGAEDAGSGKPHSSLSTAEPALDQGSDVNGPMLDLDGEGKDNTAQASGSNTVAATAGTSDSGKTEVLNDDDPAPGEMAGDDVGITAKEGTSTGGPVGADRSLQKSTGYTDPADLVARPARRWAPAPTPGDVVHTPAVAAPRTRTAATAPVNPTVVRKGMTVYSDAADLAVEALQKGDPFYADGGPQLGTARGVTLIQKSGACGACGGSMPAFLSVCPSCGAGSLQKARPTAQQAFGSRWRPAPPPKDVKRG